MSALKIASIAQISILFPKVVFTYWVVYKLLPEKSSTATKCLKLFWAFLITLLLHQLLALYVALPFAYLEIIPSILNFISLNRLSSAVIDILFVAGIGTALITIHRNKLSKERERELEKEKTTAELRLLRQQINPHFLLNTLNNLFVLARKKSKTTSEAIMKLSNLMKYVLYDATFEKVPLTNEIALINDYIELERLRYGKRLQLNFDMEGDITGELPPMLLHSLIENAFKHGASESLKDSKIDIALTVNHKELIFNVSNTYDKNALNNTQGIGLKNLKRQLELQYPDHVLETSSKDGIYKVLMKIQLTE
ncbi:sensor histidine kinase [Flagellimonas maritima]|uniref:sensor histidine kinase n=1 Tax=Flagellimonas maritima TaxID=1383885 RepID=UPI0013E08ADE|nr:histidine kinase [Allomuricauda aurantiaca]